MTNTQNLLRIEAIPNADARDLSKRRVVEIEDWGIRIKWDWDAHAPVKPEMAAYPLFDHLYRLIDPDGSKYYVSEPYELGVASMLHLQEFYEKWHIYIDGRGIWYPGETVRLVFKRRGVGERLCATVWTNPITGM